MGSGARSSPSPKPKTLDHHLQWAPLQDHPIFKSRSTAVTTNGNLAAWDADSSRLYLWESGRLHRLALRFSDDEDDEAELAASSSSSSSSSSILAASPSEFLVPDVAIRSQINQISLNVDGSSLLLSGSDAVYFMNLYEKTSIPSSPAALSGNALAYRTSNVGSQIFSSCNNSLQILQVSWHSYSNSHVGILSSDSVLRLFDLSSDLDQPEQEFYLQPYGNGSYRNAASICPVAFSFGGQHLWDRFSVFVLFSDGSTYVLCPIIPFGSVCSWAFLEELHEDLKVFGLKSCNVDVNSNSSFALDWLESTFPDLINQPLEEHKKLVLRAHPYAPLDASLTLQGPLGKVQTSEENDDSRLWSADCEGKAISLFYSSIGKDSVLVIGWSSGQLHLDALADEIQPLWNIGSSPRLRVDFHGRIKGVAMICESNMPESSSKLGQQLQNIGVMAESLSLGPPLLRLAIVDLALPNFALANCLLAMFPDPLLAERFYCLHAAGVDLITLHFLPFSNLLTETEIIEKAPSVLPIITCQGESPSTSALCGFVALADACGNSQVVGITRSFECVVLDSKVWTEATSLNYSLDTSSVTSLDTAKIPGVISNELLTGPKAIVVPPSASLKSLTADSIEGRSALHKYIKLFHENYVEYAHKVSVELEHHENYLKTILDDQNKRVADAKQLLLNVKSKELGIRDRISRAFKVYELLEQRLQNFRKLPRANKKPLSRAECEFKAQLEGFADVELDALQRFIEALNARLKRSVQPSTSTLNVHQGQSPGRRRYQVSDGQMQKIRSSMELLSMINNENTKKIDLIEHGLKTQEEE